MAPSFDFFPFPPGEAAFFAVPRRGGGFAKAAFAILFISYRISSIFSLLTFLGKADRFFSYNTFQTCFVLQ